MILHTRTKSDSCDKLACVSKFSQILHSTFDSAVDIF